MLVKEILSALIMIFILIIPGFFFGKKRIIDEHQSQGISALAVNLTWPCLVIDAMQLKFSMQTLRDSAYMMGIALLVFGAILVISFPLAKLLRLPKTKQYVMLFMLLFGNTGFIGIPVIKALYGSEAVFYAAILEMINDLLMFTIGILLMQMSAGSKLKIRAKDFLSPGLIGVLIGLALFLADFQLPFCPWRSSADDRKCHHTADHVSDRISAFRVAFAGSVGRVAGVPGQFVKITAGSCHYINFCKALFRGIVHA